MPEDVWHYTSYRTNAQLKKFQLNFIVVPYAIWFLKHFLNWSFEHIQTLLRYSWLTSIISVAILRFRWVGLDREVHIFSSTKIAGPNISALMFGHLFDHSAEWTWFTKFSLELHSLHGDMISIFEMDCRLIQKQVYLKKTTAQSATTDAEKVRKKNLSLAQRQFCEGTNWTTVMCDG